MTWQCDLPYRPKADSLINKTLGELVLRFDHLVIKADTVKFLFKYLDRDNLVISSSLRDYTELVTGVAYNTVTKLKIYVSSPNGFEYYTDNPKSRYVNSLQPDVIEYIKNNKGKIDKCFIEEAKKNN